MDTEKAPSKILKLMAKKFGFAQEKIERQLIKKGGKKLIEGRSFYVNDMEGPLEEDFKTQVEDWLKNI
jgi:hypothetical protein